jgi:multiple sugar transport system ATP-binding protein
MAGVVLEHVDKVYPGGARAVSDCSVEIADGELVVLVGPSGSGKSTVLRMVAGLEDVTSGTIRIGDLVVNELRPQERNVAMVFQDYALYPHMTARVNLDFPLRMRGLGRDERRARVERVAGALDIESLLDRLPRALSGGQRQRVAMGRALVREPAVFLMDEPLSNLDAKLRVQVRAELKDLQRRTRTTTIYVTHDQVEAMTLGDRVVVLDAGRVQQVAPPAELYERPANVFVASFVGNPPMNLLPATLVASIAGHRDVQTAGIRPEAVRLGPGSGGTLCAIVEHVENLGYETLVHLRLDGALVVARVPGMPSFAAGETVGVTFDPDRVHLFDRDGRAIGRGPD